MIGLIFSMPSEARFFLDHFNARLTYEQHGLRLYDSAGFIIGISGIGIMNSGLCVQHMLLSNPQIQGIVNIGICGTPHEDRDFGSLYQINSVKSFDHQRPLYPDILFSTSSTQSSITTFSQAVTKENKDLDAVELVDMESYGFAFAANKFLAPHRYQLLKVVSDHLDFSHINRSFVQGLMEENANDILSFLAQFRTFLDSTAQQEIVLSDDWKEFFDTFSFTVSQKNKITQHLKYRLALGESVSIPTNIPTFEHAKQRNQWVEHFLKNLGA